MNQELDKTSLPSYENKKIKLQIKKNRAYDFSKQLERNNKAFFSENKKKLTKQDQERLKLLTKLKYRDETLKNEHNMKKFYINRITNSNLTYSCLPLDTQSLRLPNYAKENTKTLEIIKDLASLKLLSQDKLLN